MGDFTHFNEQGRARMVDISDKQETVRTAVAQTSLFVTKEIYENIQQGTMAKGDVLSVAQVAGIMAAKNTSQWIPMCHPLALSGVDIRFDWDVNADTYQLKIEASVKTKGNTGVEMEALTSASATALTIYDMCKAVDKGMIIGETFLVEKTGGKNGDFKR
ncbi:cyclic pyranopterin monophosphate synthase MoaC [Salipaludibacillus agaradhaerens]|uniref:Cyclic pyranopterin monophosphate synthase n=1 Tax=Salipaludibacillus agaradhaerens TaxID=76935 RepID=A0A9Q4B3Q8_SALAG|nr:cyclic pyranopterin monophosphate synthase MoaC [Salipaludibacillus agaradhaerens]UJW56602.1 cyclic pyranopterin monophosphate synthase MoaC [Bacillus sp. A116_S68]MCR6097777.1 cyclic pyranopterin monophosphate synthase MoaC [Salipaludibacillus agaradhaerens]MCR6105370.1 cyclic pyranopterin monophosphate synthase MoaC [Salipaludibacillus agaradhaerens]MCR6116594.1 cyclic pyranopterin monophosphate synthase MoaC [Salipaludibacillus agaradhaerens]MCR6117411.1 cyclic pyranopterin monophosphate